MTVRWLTWSDVVILFNLCDLIICQLQIWICGLKDKPTPSQIQVEDYCMTWAEKHDDQLKVTSVIITTSSRLFRICFSSGLTWVINDSPWWWVLPVNGISHSQEKQQHCFHAINKKNNYQPLLEFIDSTGAEWVKMTVAFKKGKLYLNYLNKDSKINHWLKIRAFHEHLKHAVALWNVFYSILFTVNIIHWYNGFLMIYTFYHNGEEL